MKKYTVRSADGIVIGFYDADTPEDAIEACARDAAYASTKDMVNSVGNDRPMQVDTDTSEVFANCTFDQHGYIACRECTAACSVTAEQIARHDCAVAQRMTGQPCNCGQHDDEI
jgi:hypothetical protein